MITPLDLYVTGFLKQTHRGPRQNQLREFLIAINTNQLLQAPPAIHSK